IRRMVEDLCFPVEIIAGDIVREVDGLAMSSRNGFIKDYERPRANQLNKSLNWVRDRIIAGETDYAVLEDQAKARIEAAGFKPDYVSVCNSKTLEPAANDDLSIT